MQVVSVNKAQFAGLNDKRFYFHNGIVSLPFGHFLLNKVREQKEKYKTEIQHQIHDKRYGFLSVRGCLFCYRYFSQRDLE